MGKVQNSNYKLHYWWLLLSKASRLSDNLSSPSASVGDPFEFSILVVDSRQEHACLPDCIMNLDGLTADRREW